MSVSLCFAIAKWIISILRHETVKGFGLTASFDAKNKNRGKKLSRLETCSLKIEKINT